MSYRIDSHEFKQSYYKMPNSSKMGFLITMRNKLLSGEVSVNKITWLDDLISFIENELKFLKEYPLPEIRFNSFDLVPFEPFNNLNTNTDNEEKITPTVLGQQKNKMSMKDHDKIVHEFKEMPYERQIAIIYARNFYSKIEEYPFYRFETNKELMRGMILKYKIEDIDVYNCLIEQLFTHYSQYIEILPLDNKDFREFYDEIQELYVKVLHYKKNLFP